MNQRQQDLDLLQRAGLNEAQREAFKRLVKDLTAVSRPEKLATVLKKWFRRWWWLLVDLVIVALLVSVIAAYAFGYFGEKTPNAFFGLLGAVAIPAILGVAATGFSRQQQRINLTEIQAQTFSNLVEYERSIDFSEKMEIIRGLKEYDEPAYRGHRRDILDVVNFLNYLAHLIRHKYVIPHHVLLLYAPALDDCRKKLIEQNVRDGQGWLDYLRETQDMARDFHGYVANEGCRPRDEPEGCRPRDEPEGCRPRDEPKRGGITLYQHFQTLCRVDTINTLWTRKGEVNWPDPRNEELRSTPLDEGLYD